MIRHIVTFKLAATDATSKERDYLALKEQLEALGTLPGIKSLKVFKGDGTEGHWDFVLVGDYENQESLDSYQVHPDHHALVERTKPLLADRVIIDFEISGS
jgi:quinol monooxygenase YgiN